jgi:hypothetical protein
MFQENEVVMVILGFGTLLFIFSNRHQLKRLPSSATLLSSFFVLCLGWILTVLESFFFGDVLNLLEHASYAASSILLAIWCWQVLHVNRHQF